MRINKNVEETPVVERLIIEPQADEKYLYKDFLYALKWLKKNISSDTARPILRAMHKQDSILTVTDGYKICTIKLNPEFDTAFTAYVNKNIPDGLWEIKLLSRELIILQKAYGNYPDIYGVIEKAQGMTNLPTNYSTGKDITLVTHLSPGLLSQVFDGRRFTTCQFSFSDNIAMLRLNPDRIAGYMCYAFIMGMFPGDEDNLPDGFKGSTGIVDAKDLAREVYPKPKAEKKGNENAPS